MALVDRHRPLHVSIVGGEPLVRYRELNTILPLLSKRGIHVQLVTSAVREIPAEWRGIPRLSIVVSIDGLQPEHDVRRTPATYDRILKHIAGHSITVHCTVTRQQVNRQGYIEEFLQFWSAQAGREDLGQPLHAAARRGVGRTAAAGRSREGDRRPAGAAPALSEAEDAEGADRGVRRSAAVARRVRLRAHDDDHLGRSDDEDHAVPVRRRARLRATAAASRRRGSRPSARHQILGFIPVGPIFTGSLKVGERLRRMRPEPSAA